jgi:hypothetical protein
VGALPGDIVDRARRWLADNGFRLQHWRDSPAFGDHLDQWARGPVLVRLVRDRGSWYIEVGHGGWDDWFDLALVADVLGCERPDVTAHLEAVAAAALAPRRPALEVARRRRLVERGAGGRRAGWRGRFGRWRGRSG